MRRPGVVTAGDTTVVVVVAAEGCVMEATDSLGLTVIVAEFPETWYPAKIAELKSNRVFDVLFITLENDFLWENEALQL